MENKILEGDIKAGTALVFSCGEYSDYRFGEVYIALKDFNYLEQARRCYFEKAEEALADNPRYELTYLEITSEAFESFLVKEGFLGMCENREIYTGDLDFFESEYWRKEFLKQKGVQHQ